MASHQVFLLDLLTVIFHMEEGSPAEMLPSVKKT